ncbi:type 4a pilus biogenesis protein PilO [Thermosulfuriphilus sp.]
MSRLNQYLNKLISSIEAQEKRTKILLAILIFVLIPALFVNFLLMPTLDALRKVDNQCISLKRQIEILKIKSASINRLAKEMRDEERVFEKVSVILPDKKEISSLLELVAKAGKMSGLDFIRFEPQEEEIKDGYAVIPVKVSVRGTYHSFGIFFDEIKDLDRLVLVRSFKMIGPKEDSPELTLTTDCELMTFRFVDESEMKKLTETKDQKNKKGGKNASKK